MKWVLKKNNKKTVMLAIASLAFFFSCMYPEKGFTKGNDIVIEGSTTVLPIAQRAAEEFMNAHSDINITVRGGGSGVGIASLIDGTCDIADASRSMKDTELDKAVSRGKDPKAYVVAMDGIAVIVNSSNPINELTKQQVKDIFTGKISNWSQLGGPNEKIVVISRDTSSGTFEAFGELALEKQKVRPDALMEASNQAVASTVARTKGAIGYVGLAYISGEVKAVKVAGVIPSKETVLNKTYPYSRPLFMYTDGKATGAVKEFIDFVLSDEGQQIADEEGYVGLK
jgi:phosphate transport system substrate-binding protein